jgi:hypothetical protein
MSGSMGLLAVPLALSSPTSNEFKSCHALAAAHLERCLNQGGKDQTCWDLARDAKDHCYAGVVQRYAPLTEQERAARQEEVRRKAAALEQMRKEKEAASRNKP